MISALTHFLASRWKAFLILCAMCMLALGVVAKRTHALTAENRRLALTGQPPISVSKPSALAPLLEENDRLRSELKKVPELKAAIQKLRGETDDDQSEQAGVWHSYSNRIHAAIGEKQRQLQELRAWAKERDAAEKRAAAARRLEERAAEGFTNSPEEYDKIKERLANLGIARQRLHNIRSEWTQSGKTAQDRTTFQAKLKEAQGVWFEAFQQLGKDIALYEELPLPPTVDNPAGTPLLRSVIPDQNGLSATLYLDGNVIYTKVPTLP
jgi:DNA repair exonuclease SbcCD ATPase subunit